MTAETDGADDGDPFNNSRDRFSNSSDGDGSDGSADDGNEVLPPFNN
jgi:hypothetical protein